VKNNIYYIYDINIYTFQISCYEEEWVSAQFRKCSDLFPMVSNLDANYFDRIFLCFCPFLRLMCWVVAMDGVFLYLTVFRAILSICLSPGSS
jgi:hypothetical protein